MECFIVCLQNVVTYPPVVIPMDVSDLNSLPDKVAQIEKTFGHIDILINNAGISVRADVVSMAVDLDVQVMLVNYFGAVAVTKGFSVSLILSVSLLDKITFSICNQIQIVWPVRLKLTLFIRLIFGSCAPQDDPAEARSNCVREQHSGEILIAASISLFGIKARSAGILWFTSSRSGWTQCLRVVR